MNTPSMLGLAMDELEGAAAAARCGWGGAAGRLAWQQTPALLCALLVAQASTCCPPCAGMRSLRSRPSRCTWSFPGLCCGERGGRGKLGLGLLVGGARSSRRVGRRRVAIALASPPINSTCGTPIMLPPPTLPSCSELEGLKKHTRVGKHARIALNHVHKWRLRGARDSWLVLQPEAEHRKVRAVGPRGSPGWLAGLGHCCSLLPASLGQLGALPPSECRACNAWPEPSSNGLPASTLHCLGR